MPNKVITRTQVPAKPEDIYLEVSATHDEAGAYVAHTVRVLYQPKDNAGGNIEPRKDGYFPLSTGQATALASFIATITAAVNTKEGT